MQRNYVVASSEFAEKVILLLIEKAVAGEPPALAIIALILCWIAARRVVAKRKGQRVPKRR